MNEIETRLVTCFTAVFPGLRPEDTPQASVDTVRSWDSLATAQLLTTVEEEFGIEVDADALDQMCSFQQIAEGVSVAVYDERCAGVRVIVNADDLGRSWMVNGAIFDLMSRGYVSSATILANGPGGGGRRDAGRSVPPMLFWRASQRHGIQTAHRGGWACAAA